MAVTNWTDSDLAEAEALALSLAEVYSCRPEELIRAVGRQLRRSADAESTNRHVDVLAIEAIANIMDLADESLDALPVPEDHSILLAAHLAHVKECADCQVSLHEFEIFRRSADT